MLKAIHLVGLTGLKGAQMETLLEEAGVTVTKSGTILSQVRKTCGSAEQKAILTADETAKLRAYCQTQATGLAVQADFVWSQMEDFFAATSGVATSPAGDLDNDTDELGDDIDGDLDTDTDELGGDLDSDLDNDVDELGDDLDGDLDTDGDNDLDDLDGDLDGDLDNDLEGDEDDNLGGGDIGDILNGGSSAPVEYDRSSLEVDGDNLEFPDSEKDQPAAQDNSVASLFG